MKTEVMSLLEYKNVLYEPKDKWLETYLLQICSQLLYMQEEHNATQSPNTNACTD